jgi:hypothetical protein
VRRELALPACKQHFDGQGRANEEVATNVISTTNAADFLIALKYTPLLAIALSMSQLPVV